MGTVVVCCHNYTELWFLALGGGRVGRGRRAVWCTDAVRPDHSGWYDTAVILVSSEYMVGVHLYDSFCLTV